MVLSRGRWFKRDGRHTVSNLGKRIEQIFKRWPAIMSYETADQVIMAARADRFEVSA
jgi:hypothetical protein